MSKVNCEGLTPNRCIKGAKATYEKVIKGLDAILSGQRNPQNNPIMLQAGNKWMQHIEIWKYDTSFLEEKNKLEYARGIVEHWGKRTEALSYEWWYTWYGTYYSTEDLPSNWIGIMVGEKIYLNPGYTLEKAILEIIEDCQPISKENAISLYENETNCRPKQEGNYSRNPVLCPNAHSYGCSKYIKPCDLFDLESKEIPD